MVPRDQRPLSDQPQEGTGHPRGCTALTVEIGPEGKTPGTESAWNKAGRYWAEKDPEGVRNTARVQRDPGWNLDQKNRLPGAGKTL